MSNAGRLTRDVRALPRTCLVPPGHARGRRVAPLPGPDLRLVAVAALVMVLLAVGVIVAVSAAAPAAAFLPLAGLALLVRPAVVLHHRRTHPRVPVLARRTVTVSRQN